MALYRHRTPFRHRMPDQNEPATLAEFAAFRRLRRFPLLIDDDRPIAGSAIGVEQLDRRHPGPIRLIAAARAGAHALFYADWARRIATEPAHAALYSPMGAWEIAGHAHPP
mgnify:CR=1 FL=1